MEHWIKTGEQLPKDGEEVLIYYRDNRFENDVFEIATYFKTGSVMYTEICREFDSPIDNLVRTLDGNSDVYAEEEGFYFVTLNDYGDSIMKKYTFGIPYWQPLVAPK